MGGALAGVGGGGAYKGVLGVGAAGDGAPLARTLNQQAEVVWRPLESGRGPGPFSQGPETPGETLGEEGGVNSLSPSHDIIEYL